jgi:hypothetical protein
MKAVLLSSLMGITTLLPISTAIAADCYSGGGGALESMFRKEEAVRLITELNSKIMNALDKVLLSTDASRVNPLTSPPILAGISSSCWIYSWIKKIWTSSSSVHQL